MQESLQRMIEETVINILMEKRKTLGLSADELGKLVYPEVSNARMKVQTLTQKQGNGKPRSLKVGELVALAKALNMDPTRVLSKALEQFEETKT